VGEQLKYIAQKESKKFLCKRKNDALLFFKLKEVFLK